MAGFLFPTHAKIVLLQNYQIQLQLQTIELHRGLREKLISLANTSRRTFYSKTEYQGKIIFQLIVF